MKLPADRVFLFDTSIWDYTKHPLIAPDWEAALAPRACTQIDCHCHIGYVHLDQLELGKVFANGLLERIPVPEARAAGVHLPMIA